MERRERLGVLARAPHGLFEQQWGELGLDPAFDIVRGPQTGLVSARGRLGGGGAAFPFGDMVATRATVRLEDGRIGHAMLMGRDGKRVTIAAVVDALAQNEADAKRIDDELIGPLSAAIEDTDKLHAQEVAATKVDFFTMVRGEDQ